MSYYASIAQITATPKETYHWLAKSTDTEM